MKTLYDLAAPAKLNLFLHVVGRRPDGYHSIQSVFELINLCDTLHVEKTTTGHISRSDAQMPDGLVLPEHDLSTRAACLLQEATGVKAGAHVHLKKRIPMQAGMGGGSSDAATCLIALNRLWNTGLSRADLMKLGARLGADVPFFLFGRHAWVEGIGEQMQAIALPPHRYLIIKPPTGLVTHHVFTDPDLKRDAPPVTIESFLQSCSALSQPNSFSSIEFSNALEAVAKKQCPNIQIGLNWFKSCGLNGKMTGSGSALFAEANGVSSYTAPAGWKAFSCDALFEHPLKHWMH